MNRMQARASEEVSPTTTPVLEPTAPPRRVNRRNPRRVAGRVIGQRWYTPYVFMLPGLVLFGLFFAWPAVTAVEFAFYKYDIVNPPQFVGFANFTALVHDSQFWTAVRNSLVFLVGLIPLSVVLPLLLAVLVNQKIRGIQLFRVVYYLPVVTSM